jgi:chromosomal replication initiation ATPase DnaA
MNRSPHPASAAYILPGVKNSNYTEHDLIKDVCTYFKITEDEIKSKSRLTKYRRPRQVCFYFLRLKFPYERNMLHTLEYFGGLLNKNHATVLHSCNVVSNDIDTSDLFKDMIGEVEALINTHIVTQNAVSK